MLSCHIEKIHFPKESRSDSASILTCLSYDAYDTSTCLHPHPINEGVKRGEGGEISMRKAPPPRKRRSVDTINWNLLLCPGEFDVWKLYFAHILKIVLDPVLRKLLQERIHKDGA